MPDLSTEEIEAIRARDAGVFRDGYNAAATDRQWERHVLCLALDAAEALVEALTEERDAATNAIRESIDRFRGRASWCMHGNPNQWMEGEARGNIDAAAHLQRVLDRLVSGDHNG